MKRLAGGMVLLNLTAISLGLTSGQVDITDEGVLQELAELRSFIDVGRDFSKGFKSLKPILIEYRSSASSFNGIALANMAFHTDALHMSIGCLANNAGKYLNIDIEVVYEWTDYVGYTVKTAKINAYEKTAVTGASVTGDVDITGDVAVTGDTTLTGELSVTGDASIFEKIVDADGHKRFIEGDGTANQSLENVYCKWSLSGSHLMLVCAGTVPADTTLADFTNLASFGVPAWVFAKVVPTMDSLVEYKECDAISSEFNRGTLRAYLEKTASSLAVTLNGEFTTDVDRAFRIQFDLLIDNEETPAP